MKSHWFHLVDPPIRFRHHRAYDEEGYIKNSGGVTFAYQVDTKNRVLNMAWAMCCETDNFCRATGRTIASTRLMQVNNNYHRAYQLTTDPKDEAALIEEVNTLLEKANDEIFQEWCDVRGISTVEEGNETEAHSSAV